MRSRTYKTEAVVLRQMPLGEADRILTLFTPDMGKVRVIAKGVRRLKSRYGGHLELLNRVAASLTQGRDLDIVNEAQIIESHRPLREDLPRLAKAFYLAELVDGFTAERSPNEPVYRMLLRAFALLGSVTQPDLMLRHFEVHLLGLSGYRPELYRCIECRSELEPADHLFSPGGGGVVCRDCRTTSGSTMVPVSINAMKVLRFVQRSSDATAVDGLKVSAGVLREIERLTRTYIRFLVEREVKSADFMGLVSSRVKN